MKELISIVVPCYNEQEALPIFYKTITPILQKMEPDYELIFVDDGSKDNTASIMKKIAKDDEKVKYVIFSRNFGKEAAMYAGLEHTKGDFVAIMDVDLQDPPELIIDFVKKWEDGYDMVYGIRSDRGSDTFLKRFTAKLFYKIYKVQKNTLNIKNKGVVFNYENKPILLIGLDSILKEELDSNASWFDIEVVEKDNVIKAMVVPIL